MKLLPHANGRRHVLAIEYCTRIKNYKQNKVILFFVVWMKLRAKVCNSLGSLKINLAWSVSVYIVSTQWSYFSSEICCIYSSKSIAELKWLQTTQLSFLLESICLPECGCRRENRSRLGNCKRNKLMANKTKQIRSSTMSNAIWGRFVCNATHTKIDFSQAQTISFGELQVGILAQECLSSRIFLNPKRNGRNERQN